ncbi:MAG: hypothetical protein DRP63_08185, partial [Planctomycetota bacterium]
GRAYSDAFTAQGGNPPYTWSETTNNLSSYGLTLNNDGSITGTPTNIGVVRFTVEVKDSGSPQQTVTFSTTIVVYEEILAALSWSTAMEADSSGNLYVALTSNYNTKIATNAGGSWSDTLVTYKHVVSDVRRDGSGTLHLLTYDFRGHRLYHWWLESGNWKSEFICVARLEDKRNFRLAAGGSEVAVFYKEIDRPGVHCRRKSNNWQEETVDGSVSQTDRIAADCDSNGNPYVAYMNSTTKDVVLATYNGTAWQTETPWSGHAVENCFDMRLDSNNTPHIVQGYDGKIYHIWFDGSDWQNEQIRETSFDELSVAPVPTSLSAAGVSVLFNDTSGDCEVRHAYKNGSGWQVETIRAPGNAWMFYIYGAHDGTDLWTVWAEGGADFTIKVSQRDSATGTWSSPTTIFTHAGDVIMGGRATVDANGRPHAACVKVVSFQAVLAWAERTGANTWTIENADDPSNPAYDPGLEIDERVMAAVVTDDDTRHIVFFDHNNDGRLMHLYRKSGATSWSANVVDSDASDIQLLSACKEGDDLRVAYQRENRDTNKTELCYAKYDAANDSWSVEVLGEVSASCLAFLIVGSTPHIALGEGNNIYHLWYDGSDWQEETVVSGATDNVTAVAIAADSSSNLYVAYKLDNSQDPVKLTTKPSGGSWSTSEDVPGIGNSPLWEGGICLHLFVVGGKVVVLARLDGGRARSVAKSGSTWGNAVVLQRGGFTAASDGTNIHIFFARDVSASLGRTGGCYYPWQP